MGEESKILFSNVSWTMHNAQCVMLKAKLSDIIDEDVDSLRFYYLGNQYKTKVEHVGVDRGTPADGILIM